MTCWGALAVPAGVKGWLLRRGGLLPPDVQPKPTNRSLRSGVEVRRTKMNREAGSSPDEWRKPEGGGGCIIIQLVGGNQEVKVSVIVVDL